MKQKKLIKNKIISLLLILLIISISIWLPNAFIDWWYAQVVGVNLIYMLVWFFSSFFIFVVIHEMAHALAFLIKGIRIRAIYLVFLVIYKDIKWHIRIFLPLLKMMGGLVFPEIHSIKDHQSYQKTIQSLRFSLIIAPITSWLWTLSITFLWGIIRIENFQNHLFYFMLFTWIWTIIYSITFFVKSDAALGDIKAFIALKEMSHFQVIQLLQFTKFSKHQDTQTLRYLGTLNRMYLMQSYALKLLDQMALQYEVELLRRNILKPDVSIKEWAKKINLSRLYHTKYDSELVFQSIIYLRQLGLDNEAAKLYLKQPKKLNEAQEIARNKLHHIMFDVEVDIQSQKVYDSEIDALFIFSILIDPHTYIKQQYEKILYSPWVCLI